MGARQQVHKKSVEIVSEKRVLGRRQISFPRDNIFRINLGRFNDFQVGYPFLHEQC
jgi:hypothetical protein